MNRSRIVIPQLLLVLAVCAFFFFFGLGAFGLVGADEPRYAQVAREMLARHDWIVPTLNGHPWLEKPVLLYWLEMLAYSVFGVHGWAARVPSAALATALAVAAFFFMRRFRPGSEMDAAFIMASFAAMIGFGRGASTDMPLTAPFSAAMLAWWAWHETGNRLALAGFYACLAVGALAKGPIAPGLAVLIVAAYSFLRRDGKIFLRSLWLPGFALFFVIVLPWYVAVQLRVPQFFHEFFLRQNLERFSTNLYQHKQPFWYYVPVFLLAVLPWIVFTLPALEDASRAGWRRLRGGAPDGQPDAQEDWLALFLWLWLLIPIVFFSISQSKLPGYILPAVPAAALLTALDIHRKQTVARVKLALHALVCGGVLAAALLAPWSLMRQPVAPAARIMIPILAGVMAVIVLVAVRSSGTGALRFATLVPLVLGLGFLLRGVAPAIDDTQSARPLAAELVHLGVGGREPFAVFNVKREAEYGLNFYLNQPILRYERDGVPAQAHIVIVKAGSAGALQALLGDRKAVSVATFAPQRLQFFVVSNSQ